MRTEQPVMAFVMPLRNPRDAKVADYKCLLAMSQQTVNSILTQTEQRIVVIVVGHGSGGHLRRDSRVHWIDVDGHPAFMPDPIAQFDKGLRFISGARYAWNGWQPRFTMLLDADDYVNRTLTDVVRDSATDGEHDGYLLTRGVHVRVSVAADYHVMCEEAFIISRFDQTCGSCRIFHSSRLQQKLESIDSDFGPRFAAVRPQCSREHIQAALAWLAALGTPGQDAHTHIRTVGRHIRQEELFSMRPLPFIGAAKGCGHGNHNGPGRGRIHTERVVGQLDIRTFRRVFGVDGGTAAD